MVDSTGMAKHTRHNKVRALVPQTPTQNKNDVFFKKLLFGLIVLALVAVVVRRVLTRPGRGNGTATTDAPGNTTTTPVNTTTTPVNTTTPDPPPLVPVPGPVYRENEPEQELSLWWIGLILVGILGILCLAEYSHRRYARSHEIYTKGTIEHERVTSIVYDYGKAKAKDFHKQMMAEGGNRTPSQQVDRMIEMSEPRLMLVSGPFS